MALSTLWLPCHPRTQHSSSLPEAQLSGAHPGSPSQGHPPQGRRLLPLLLPWPPPHPPPPPTQALSRLSPPGRRRNPAPPGTGSPPGQGPCPLGHRQPGDLRLNLPPTSHLLGERKSQEHKGQDQPGPFPTWIFLTLLPYSPDTPSLAAPCGRSSQLSIPNYWLRAA